MKIHHIIPFSLEKDLGKAYNEEMALIPDGDAALITDYDVMLLTPDARLHIQKYAEQYPGTILTCYTNRIHPLSKQLMAGMVNKIDSIEWHIQRAEERKEFLYQATPLIENISGFLFVLPKKIWQQCSFIETGNCIGVDTAFFKRAIAKGIKVLRMDGIYVWHTYRLGKSITDKSHL